MERVVCPYCGEELTVDSACDILPEGFTINGFEIVRLLASGSSGRVYLANQVAVERLVAIKILKRSLAEKKEAAERFINEARNTAKFQYPNIVTTLEAGNAGGFYYIAMQYVRGETLEKLLDDGKIFSEAEALSVVLKIAGALRLIWEKHRMFHKDIKPANIMLDSDNEAMLLDMGIAQEAGEDSLINGEVEGSPFYMSPEQIQGKTLTWSTDLYSLGATLYHMVTGYVPFYDPSIDRILDMHNNAPYPEPSERAPGSCISPELSALMKRMRQDSQKALFLLGGVSACRRGNLRGTSGERAGASSAGPSDSCRHGFPASAPAAAEETLDPASLRFHPDSFHPDSCGLVCLAQQPSGPQRAGRLQIRSLHNQSAGI